MAGGLKKTFSLSDRFPRRSGGSLLPGTAPLIALAGSLVANAVKTSTKPRRR